jgi:hypothetical protein
MAGRVEEESSAPGRTPFEVVAAYGDSTTRDRALELFQRIARQLEKDCEFECSWWRLDLLRDAQILEQAASQAARANMIILSLCDRDELAQSSKRWITSWLAKRGGQKAALVALVAGTKRDERDKGPLLPYLQDLAKEARMDFFLHWFEMSESPPTTTPATRTNSKGAPAPPAPPPTLSARQPASRWGINE